MNTKIIFLDIDGVLNDLKSTSICTFVEEKREITGIDNTKVKRLKKICDETNAILILISSWKLCWERYNKNEEYSPGRYLDQKLKKYGLK